MTIARTDILAALTAANITHEEKPDGIIEIGPHSVAWDDQDRSNAGWWVSLDKGADGFGIADEFDLQRAVRMVGPLTVHVDSAAYGDEGRAFARWLEGRGYEVRRQIGVDGPSDGLADQWDRYCEDC